MKYRVVCSILGQNPTFVGTFDESSALQIANAFKSMPSVEVYEDIPVRGMKMRANPKSLQDVELNEKFLLDMLKKPLQALTNAPLKETCTVGRPEMCAPSKKGLFPISVADVSDISMDEVVAHLSVFIPSARTKLPKSILDRFQKGHRYIGPEYYKDLDGAKAALINTLFRQNTKLSKSKVPSSLKIGKPSGLEGLNEAPTAGAIGLSFLPNTTLLRTSVDTGEKGFKQALEESILGDAYLNAREYAQHSTISKEQKRLYSTRIAVDLCLETLKGLKGNACISASKGCRKACLVNSGQRYATQKTIFDESTKDFDVMQNRMLLGFWQTAFIANPLYFLRLLIESIYSQAVSYEIQLAEYNLHAKYFGDEDDTVDIKKYLERLPLSIRLNVYTDYPWELIYPDMFDLFSLKKPKGFVETNSSGDTVKTYRGLRVQFYDYTKVPGRWPKRVRASIWKELGLSVPPRAKNSLDPKDQFAVGRVYDLPDNYHLTFSYNGTERSLAESFISNIAGQNSTFVFASQQIVNSTFLKLIDAGNVRIGGLGGAELAKNLKAFNSLFRKTLTKIARDKGVTALSTVASDDSLPQRLSYKVYEDTFSYDVISGDAYDLRFLDTEMKKSLGIDAPAVVVGLKWKTPSNLKLNVSGKNYEMSPINASVLNVALNKVEGDVQIASGFAESRIGLGVGFNAPHRGLVSLYLLAEDSTLESTQKVIESVVKLTEDDIVTFATETGRLINDGISPEEISEGMLTVLDGIFSSSSID